MHGLPNLKICLAKQAKQIFHYKKIKIKLYKNNAAIWFNKTCRIKNTIGLHTCTVNITDLLNMSG